ncbi:MAG TPA: pseudouridine-5'-phosphate glycosidase [Rectinemataceae bacterium]|nr:pseudouridine-5'-phosphate glycosidase [Rectinemataceae bacterium]
MNQYLDLSPEVAAALREKRPVVALESTIISHGMPYPQNVETALRVEEAVRRAGAVPATVAVLGGRLRAGLEGAQIEALGRAGLSVAKASRRDLPRLVAEGRDGATTVAATMIVAALAGIRVFATGGIGGVHRGAERSWDVSADLEELAATEVTVVCAGAKAILDLPMTLEYLETKGVPVVGYGTDELPAFYTSSSGLRLEERADSPEYVARLMKAKWGLGLGGGIVVANPVPERYSMEKSRIDAAIERALAAAAAEKVHGKEVTPFLLAKVKELTGGDSLEANIALVLNNAELAARIAAAFAALRG